MIKKYNRFASQFHSLFHIKSISGAANVSLFHFSDDRRWVVAVAAAALAAGAVDPPEAGDAVVVGVAVLVTIRGYL